MSTTKTRGKKNAVVSKGRRRNVPLNQKGLDDATPDAPSRSKLRLRGQSLADYLRLVKEFPLVSIKSESQLARVQQVIDRVFSKGRLERGEEVYLDALG